MRLAYCIAYMINTLIYRRTAKCLQLKDVNNHVGNDLKD